LVATACAVHSAQKDQRVEEDEGYGDDDEVVIILNDTANPDAVPAAFLCAMDADETLNVHVQPLDDNGDHRGVASMVAVTCLDWINEAAIVNITFDEEDQDTVVQYTGRDASGFNLQFRGATTRVSARTTLEHTLHAHMLPEEKLDVSKFLLCPMPGKVVSCDVQAGQRVEIGQELAVVEAMKMQNVLRAEKGGIIKVVNCKAGDTLKVDAIILEFEESQ
jgi:acetyl/propionyl-CoA carboxylase alpha subunit